MHTIALNIAKELH